MNLIRNILSAIFLIATVVGFMVIVVKANQDPWILFPFVVFITGCTTAFLLKIEL